MNDVRRSDPGPRGRDRETAANAGAGHAAANAGAVRAAANAGAEHAGANAGAVRAAANAGAVRAAANAGAVRAADPAGSDPHAVKEAANAAAVRRFHAPDAYRRYESNPYLRERNEILLDVLPEDARTVLDVGSGPGVVGHAFESTGRFVVSTDLSRAALAAGPPHPYLASATDLPHRDRSFDLVVSLEMLEHIPDETLRLIVGEMSRLTRRWILVGVPHRENLERNHLLCPGCGHRFNRTGHVQSFDRDRLTGLFPGFALRWSQICGPPVRDYPATLLGLRHDVARRFSEMSGHGANVCPRCGETEFAQFRHNLLSFALDGLNKLVSRRRPYWILGLLERR